MSRASGRPWPARSASVHASRIERSAPRRLSRCAPSALLTTSSAVGGVFARSGLASKQGLRPANCVGVIDADYRGECTVALHNDTDAPRTVAPGDRIAQLVILPFLAAEFSEADALDATDRGAGGFGSTGR